MKLLVWTRGTSVVEMPGAEELETAVMVTVWVCTRGGCGWEHSPMSGCLTTHLTAMCVTPCIPFLAFAVWRDFPLNSPFSVTKLDFWKQHNHLVTSLPTTNYLKRKQGDVKSHVCWKDEVNVQNMPENNVLVL